MTQKMVAVTVACLSAILLMYEKGKQYTLKEIEEILSSVGFIDFQSIQPILIII